MFHVEQVFAGAPIASIVAPWFHVKHAPSPFATDSSPLA